MKFSVSSKVFYSYASAVIKVINPKNALTVFNNFLLTLDGDTLIIKGSDVENSLSARVPVTNMGGNGSVCVDAQRLVGLFKEIPDQGVTVTIEENNKIVINYSNGECEFVGIDGMEYPTAQQDGNDTVEPVNFVLPAEVITKGLENTMFATATENFRPIMMGVLLDVKQDSITFVATDTRKLVKYTDSNVAPGVTVSRVLPIKPASILRSIFGSAKEDVKVIFTGRTATFETESYSFNCRFLEGAYPDYNRVIPRNNTLVLNIDRQALLNAVRRVGLFVSTEYGLVKFMISPDQLELKSQDPNLMTGANESVPCSFTGQKLVIGFMAAYLIEILGTIGTQDISISLSDPGRPGLFRPSEDKPGTELVMLLMPMTVGEY